MQPMLQGKKILVAGSSQGLGYATVEASANEGASVFLGSRNDENLMYASSKI